MSQEGNSVAAAQRWLVVAASATGRSHLAGGTPCQDAFYHEALAPDFGIALVCDGAGSAANSALGAAHVARQCGPELLKKYIAQNRLNELGPWPGEPEWTAFCHQAVAEMARSVQVLAVLQEVPFSSMACTVIFMIYGPQGILVSHVGDGRAAYLDNQQSWQPMILPHKGEEANQTVFLTSVDWSNAQPLIMSRVSVPECRVIPGRVSAFALMTDGCEHHSFSCSVMDAEAGRWQDPNQPYPGFFNPLVAELAVMAREALSPEAVNADWEKFLHNGTTGLAAEPDDKTMVLGTLISNG